MNRATVGKWSRCKLGLASASVLAVILLAAPVVLNRIAQPHSEEETESYTTTDAHADDARQAELALMAASAYVFPYQVDRFCTHTSQDFASLP